MNIDWQFILYIMCINDFGYYALALVVLVVGLFVLKKVATCMIKAMVAVVMIAVLAVLYWLFC